jgi:hypothetical protein
LPFFNGFTSLIHSHNTINNCTFTSSHNTSTSSQNTNSSHNTKSHQVIVTIHLAIITICTTYCLWPRLCGMTPVPRVQRSDARRPHGGVGCVGVKGASLSNCDNSNSAIIFVIMSRPRSGASLSNCDNPNSSIIFSHYVKAKVRSVVVKRSCRRARPRTTGGVSLQSRTGWVCGGGGWATSSKTPTRQPQWLATRWSLRCSFYNLNPSQYGDYTNLHNHIILPLLISKACA